MYPTEYMYGRPQGKIGNKKTYIKAIFKGRAKSFCFKKYKKRAKRLAIIWLIKKSEEKGLMKNQFRFIDENTMEVKNVIGDKTFLCDKNVINIIVSNQIRFDKDKYITVFKKKIGTSFTKCLGFDGNPKFLNNNRLDLRLSNIYDPKKITNESSIYFDMYTKKEILPEYILLLGKPAGYYRQKNSGNSDLLLDDSNSSEDKKKEPDIKNKSKEKKRNSPWLVRFNYIENGIKKIKESTFKNENDAIKWRINASKEKNITVNEIMIMGNYIKVHIKDDIYMYTDKVYLNLVQTYYITSDKSECIITIDGIKHPFHKIITNYQHTTHLNSNYFDNRLINLFNRKNTISDDSDIKYDTYNNIYYFVSYIGKKGKKFLE
jgi:hypothetical protein